MPILKNFFDGRCTNMVHLCELGYMQCLVRVLGAGYAVRLPVSHIETRAVDIVRGVEYYDLTVK